MGGTAAGLAAGRATPLAACAPGPASWGGGGDGDNRQRLDRAHDCPHRPTPRRLARGNRQQGEKGPPSDVCDDGGASGEGAAGAAPAVLRGDQCHYRRPHWPPHRRIGGRSHGDPPRPYPSGAPRGAPAARPSGGARGGAWGHHRRPQGFGGLENATPGHPQGTSPGGKERRRGRCPLAGLHRWVAAGRPSPHRLGRLSCVVLRVDGAAPWPLFIPRSERLSCRGRESRERRQGPSQEARPQERPKPRPWHASAISSPARPISRARAPTGGGTAGSRGSARRD